MKPILASARDMHMLLTSLPLPAVITKNKTVDGAKNFRRDSRKAGRWLDGIWRGQPREVIPNEGFGIHFVVDERLVWIGEYQGVQPEPSKEGPFYSLILDNVHCYEVVDWDEDITHQRLLKAILQQDGAQTYSYHQLSGADKGARVRSRMVRTQAQMQKDAYKMALVKVRLQQQRFRDLVFEHHGAQCIITGCKVPALLDAAHLPGKSWEKGDNKATDGIPLRVDLHRALDHKLIRLDKQLRLIYLAPSLRAEYGHYLNK